MTGMHLFSAHGEADIDGHYSLADRFGLSEFLGYRPVWCSGLYADSLADSWFSLWAAAPRFIEVLSFYDTADYVEIDALAWTRFMHGAEYGHEGALERCDQIDAIFDTANTPRWRKEYLINPDAVKTSKNLPIVLFSEGGLRSGALIDFLGYFYKIADDDRTLFDEAFRRICDDGIEQAELNGWGAPLPIESQYRLFVQPSGLISLLWSVGLGRNLAGPLLSVASDDLCPQPGCAYDQAQQLRAKWDAEPQQFTPDDFALMYEKFQQGLLSAVTSRMRTYYSNVGRNEPCPCGSGDKYKRCHGSPHPLDWYADVERS